MTKGITFGAFDLCHVGHHMLFKHAKSYCNHLIVGLHVDPSLERDTKNKPVQSLFERYTILSSIKYIDEIVVYEKESEIEPIMMLFRDLSYRFLGSDYKGKSFTGSLYCFNNFIKIVYIDRNHGYSTTELRNRIESSSDR